MMEMFSTTVLLHNVILFIAIVSTAATIPTKCDTCDSPWYKTYENDDQGNAVSGSRDDLLLAQSNGYTIRFLIPSWGNDGYLTENTYYFNTAGHVCALSRTHMSNSLSNTFPDELYLRFFLVCTNGYYGQQYYKVDTNEWIQTKGSTGGIQWFTKKSACRQLLSPSEFTEEAIKESRMALTNSILNGHDVTVYAVDYIFEFNSIEITPDENIVGHQSVFPIPLFFFLYVKPPLVHADISAEQFHNSLIVFTDLYTSKVNIATSDKTKWYADSCWRHVYTHDENGNKQDGSLSELVSAVQSGHRVKIVMGNYSVKANNVRTKSEHVSVQLLNRITQKVNGAVSTEINRVLQIAHTTGTVNTLKLTFVHGIFPGKTTEKKTISWFVDTRPWTKILSTNKNGEVIFGSKVELKKAIQNGAQVRVALQVDYDNVNANSPSKRHVGWWETGGHSWWGRHRGSAASHGSSNDCVEKGWLVFKAVGLVLGPSGEVSAELGKSVSSEEVGSAEFKVKDEPFWRFRIVTTQGDVDISQIRVGKETNEGHFSVKQAMNWFVNY